MARSDLANPGILSIFDRDSEPGMVFVFRIGRIEGRFATQTFDADIVDTSKPGIQSDTATAQTFFDGCHDKRVHGDEITLNGFDDTIPNEIAAAGFPNETPIAD